MKTVKILGYIALGFLVLTQVFISIALNAKNPIQDIAAWTTTACGVLALITFIAMIIVYIRDRYFTKK